MFKNQGKKQVFIERLTKEIAIIRLGIVIYTL